MDLGKMGEFIRTERKARGLTQKEVAEHVFKTEQAVSKWERGLCAPDLATLEPLAELLEVTISELIAGERATEPMMHVTQDVKEALAYSQVIMKQEVQGMRKKHVVIVAAVLMVVLIAAGVLWWNGVFQMLGRAKSPDGTMTVTVYEGDLFFNRMSKEPGISIGVSGAKHLELVCGDHYSNYQGIYWSPDSTKFIVCIEQNGVNALLFENMELNHSTNLEGEIKYYLYKCELGKYQIDAIEFSFLQWGDDNDSVLVSYIFREENGTYHKGYLWYNTRTEEINGVWDKVTFGIDESDFPKIEKPMEDPREDWPELTGTLKKVPISAEGTDITAMRLYCEESDAAMQYIVETNWDEYAEGLGDNLKYSIKDYQRKNPKELIYHYKEHKPKENMVYDVRAWMEGTSLFIDVVSREAKPEENAETDVTILITSKWTIENVKMTVDGEIIVSGELGRFGPELPD